MALNTSKRNCLTLHCNLRSASLLCVCQVTSFRQAAGRVSSSEVWTLHQPSASAHQHRHQADCAAYSTVCEGDNILTVDTPHL